jgi:hypothetical protein
MSNSSGMAIKAGWRGNLWKSASDFHRKLTWLPPSRNQLPLEYSNSRWNKPGAKGSARETACGPLGVFGPKKPVLDASDRGEG